MRKILFTLVLIIYELSVVGQIPEYTKLLRQYSTYSQIKYSIPQFIYQSCNTDELKTFRHRFKIDSIAGLADEFDQQIRLLKWVNRNFKHNGSSPLPERFNADTLIKLGQNAGVNCGGLALILNTAYLSLGFKSRFITCLNNDTIFNDPHTLTIVFSKKFNKWIMVDPTYCAYFTGVDGIPLSMEEIRIRFANNLKVNLDKDFNFNSISTTAGSVEDYLEYITRNMFRFISPVNNGFNWNMVCLDYINLIPQGYKLGLTPLGKEFIDGCSKVYCIDNQEIFWK